MKHNLSIIIKTTREFAPLPEGEAYHNPNSLDAEDIPAGFRLLTRREQESDFNGHPIRRWDADSQTFVDTIYRFSSLRAYSCIVSDTVPLVVEPPFKITNYIAGEIIPSREKFLVVAKCYSSLYLDTPVKVLATHILSACNQYESFNTIRQLLATKTVNLKSFSEPHAMFKWLAE